MSPGTNNLPAGASVLGSRDVYPEKELTERIIGCAIEVHRALGPGFLESIYENALAHELAKQGLRCERQKTITVYYDGQEVGQHRLDLLVEGRVVVELKSVDTLVDAHLAQTLSSLKAAGVEIGLLMNFNQARMVDGVRRVVRTRTP